MELLIEPDKRTDVLAKAAAVSDFGVRGHVRALELADMSASQKAATCRRTPKLKAARTTGLPLGLLINFNVPILKNGIQRVVYTNNKTALRPSSLGG